MRYQAVHDNEKKIVTMTQTNLPFDNHFHQCLEFDYVRSGEGILVNVFDSVRPLHANEIVFVGSMVPHSIETIGDTVCSNLIIPPQFFAHLPEYNTAFFHYEVFEDPTITAKMLQLFDEIKLLTDTPYDQLLQAYVDVLLLTIQKECPHLFSDTKIVNTADIVSNILNYIYVNSATDLTLKDVATHFGYSQTYFSKMFNENFHCNFKTYLNCVRLNKVISLRRQYPNKSLAYVVDNAGFNSMASYYRALKANSPLPPLMPGMAQSNEPEG